MVAVWLGPLWPPRSWSPSSRVDSGSVTCFTSAHQKILSSMLWAACWGWSQLRCFWRLFRHNVASFSYSFGILLPAIADRFKVGRAEAALTSSFMTLLTLGSGGHYIWASPVLGSGGGSKGLPGWFLATYLEKIWFPSSNGHFLVFWGSKV